MSFKMELFENDPTGQTVYTHLAVCVVSAYVSKNSLAAAELPALLCRTYAALSGLSETAAPAVGEASAAKLTFAQIKKSITPDALISFIDGKRYKTLKRHLSTRGLDPHAYRQRYGLPDDYPMVAPNYAKRRSDLAKAIGFGRPGARLSPDKALPKESKPAGRGKAS